MTRKNNSENHLWLDDTKSFANLKYLFSVNLKIKV